MRLAAATYKAETVRGPKAAATLYNEIEYELALGGGGSEEDYEQGEDALRVLRDRFPDVERQARETTTPPRTSRRAGANLHGTRQRREPSAGSERGAGGRRRAAPRQEVEQREEEGKRPRGVAREAARAQASELTGIGREVRRQAAGAADQIPTGGWGSLVSYTILGGIGLSLLYLALTKTNGISELMLGITNTVSAIISPSVDPLNPSHGVGSAVSVRGTGTHRPVLPRSAPLGQGITITRQATNVSKGLIP